MKDLISKIREKPHDQKSKIVWLAAGIIAVVLLIAWAIIGIPKRNSDGGQVINDFTKEIEDSKDTIPNLLKQE